MTLTIIALSISIAATISSCVAIWLGLSARIDIEAAKRATHSIQYVPVDQLGGVKADDDKSRREAEKLAPNGLGLDLDDAF